MLKPNDGQVMPAYRSDGIAAFQTAAKNKAARWARVAADERADRVGSGCYLPLLTPKFQVDRHKPIFAMGSCFAENIQVALAVRDDDFNLITFMNNIDCDDLFKLSNNDFYPMSFLHRYNPPSIYQEINRILDDSSILNDDTLIFRTKPDEFRDFHYHEHFPLPTLERSVYRRRFLRDRFLALKTCGLFVLTLGLTEAWLDHETGLYLNTAPSYGMVTSSRGRFEFMVLDWNTVYHFLEKIVNLLESSIPGIKIILTVSPVPLEATFAPHDVVVSTTYSKATLLSAAREIVYQHPSVDYFPSYEMVFSSARDGVWVGDERHIQQDFVAKIMGHFIRYYVDVA